MPADLVPLLAVFAALCVLRAILWWFGVMAAAQDRSHREAEAAYLGWIEQIQKPL